MNTIRVGIDHPLTGSAPSCCDRAVAAGDAVLVTTSIVPRVVHVLCAQRATERASR